jgi:hypothetical protein
MIARMVEPASTLAAGGEGSAASAGTVGSFGPAAAASTPGSVGTVETQYLDLPAPIRLDCGQELYPVRVAY